MKYLLLTVAMLFVCGIAYGQMMVASDTYNVDVTQNGGSTLDAGGDIVVAPLASCDTGVIYGPDVRIFNVTSDTPGLYTITIGEASGAGLPHVNLSQAITFTSVTVNYGAPGPWTPITDPLNVTGADQDFGSISITDKCDFDVNCSETISVGGVGLEAGNYNWDVEVALWL